jgi:shikimate kinase / 3-dehydroquinate synthase
MTKPHPRIYLVGLSASGKTATAPLLAARLGWDWIDLDQRIEETAGESIPAIFARGEAEFRERECAALATVAQREQIVIATGGGVVLSLANRQLMRETGAMVALSVTPEVAARRLATHDVERPLLRGDTLARLRQLSGERAPLYAEAHLTIATDALTAEDTVGHIIAGLAARGLLHTDQSDATTIEVPLGPQSYAITAGWGELARLADHIATLSLPHRLSVITDTNIADLFLSGVLDSLTRSGCDAHAVVIPAGEASKSLEQLGTIYDALIERRHERGEPIVALGGGVVGDLAGFVAATYLRGVPLIQVPTTLLAMVDSAIGGKTGINHPRAKNSIGAFYQPRAVVCDPAVLLTLPDRTFREGWGEIVKYGMALDGALFALLETEGTRLLDRNSAQLLPIIARCAQIKADIVAGDEREAGRRMILNYGHTIGHALEAIAGYGTLLHGEAVFLGMAVEARIAHRLDLLSAEAVARQDALSRIFYAPESVPAIEPEAILAATRLDKKTRGGRINWVLPIAVGATTITADVPDDLVLDVLRDWHHT